MKKARRTDPIHQRIEEKVIEIKALENDFPCVIIIHDIRDWTVVHMSQSGLDNLKISIKELQAMGAKYHEKYFNAAESKEYVPKILSLIQTNGNNNVSYFQQVRPSPVGDWEWHLSSTRIILWDEKGQPVLTLSVAIPIDQQHHFASKIERLLQENNFLRKNLEIFNTLSKREKEVLALTAQGLNSSQIASQLFISEETAATHRKNIRRKINAKTSYDLTKFAQAFNLI